MRSLLAVAGVALALAAAGCGGGSGLSQDEWAERADEICAQAQEELRRVEVPGELSEVPGYVDRTLPIAERELRELRALEPSDDLRPRVQELLDAVERALDAARRLGDAAERNDLEQARDVGQEAQAAAGEVERLARELGAETCADQ